MKHGSLFSGIGGFDLAAQWMGWENVFQCEIDSFCQKVLQKNFPNVKRYCDITKTDFTFWRGGIDVLSGGFPCQDISVSKKNATGISGKRSGLWKEYHRAIFEINPRFVLIENTPQLLRAGFEKVLYDLSEIGYNAQWQCLSASQFGFNHSRKRVFIIAYPFGSNVEGMDFFKSLRTYKKEPCRRKLARTINEALPANDYTILRKPSYGISETMEQLKSTGNAVVPGLILEIFKAIEAIAKP